MRKAKEMLERSFKAGIEVVAISGATKSVNNLQVYNSFVFPGSLDE
jgi:hypothetical protein